MAALTYSEVIDNRPLCVPGKWIRNTTAQLRIITEDLLLKNKIEEIKVKILIETNSKSSSIEDVQELKNTSIHPLKYRLMNIPA